MGRRGYRRGNLLLHTTPWLCSNRYKSKWIVLRAKLAFRPITLAKLTQCDYIEGVRGIYEEEGEIPVQNVSMKQLRKEFRPQKGFGENPITAGSFYELTDSMAKRALYYGILGDLKAFADKAGFRSVRLYNPDSLDGFELIQEYPSGGKVYKHESYGRKKLPEEKIAHWLAERSKVVKLLPRSDLLLSPDLWIDGEIWEVKSPAAGTKNSILQALRTKGAHNVILQVPDSAFNDAKRLAHDRVNRSGAIKKIWIISSTADTLIQVK